MLDENAVDLDAIEDPAGPDTGEPTDVPRLHADERTFWDAVMLAALRYGPDRAVHEADWAVQKRRLRCSEYTEQTTDPGPFGPLRVAEPDWLKHCRGEAVAPLPDIPSVPPRANVSPITEGVDFLPTPLQPHPTTRPITGGFEGPSASDWFSWLILFIIALGVGLTLWTGGGR